MSLVWLWIVVTSWFGIGRIYAWTSSASPIVSVVSWDVLLSESLEWRIDQGINAAKHVWPFLVPPDVTFDGIQTTEDEEVVDNLLWLRNKMRAIVPYLGGLRVEEYETSISPTVEYAILARLLLEEQRLDPSIGRRGKYASQFHPQQGLRSIAIPSMQGTRPLTVGEIQVNWIDTILETLLVKYAIDRQNPIPVIQKCIDQQNILPPNNMKICNAIQDSKHQTIILASCQSELSMVRNLVPNLPIKTLETVDNTSCILSGHSLPTIRVLCEKQPKTPVVFITSDFMSMKRSHGILHMHPNLKLIMATTDPWHKSHIEMDPKISLLAEDELVNLFLSMETSEILV
jgi:hypothetical protein